MPIYEYQCSNCSRVYEELVGVGDGKQSGCPRCGQAARKRVPSQFAITAVPATRSGGAPAAGKCCGGSSSCGCR